MPEETITLSAVNKPKKVKDSAGPPLYVDTITESVISNGTMHLSLGSVIQDMAADPEIEIVCRLRLNMVTAQNLHQLLGHCINEMTRRAQATQPPAPQASQQKTAPKRRN